MLFVFIYIYCYPTRFPYQMMFVLFNSKTTSVTGGAGTDNPSGASEVSPRFFSKVPVAQSLIFYAMFCRQSSFLFLLVIALSVFLCVTTSDYPFRIFKIFFTILFKTLAGLLPNTFTLLSISIFRAWAYPGRLLQ